MIKRIKMFITGRVQGVGFRPTVYRYAHELKLSGFIKNTGFGVTIEVEGEEIPLETFLTKVRLNAPERALIQNIDTHYLPACHDSSFKIESSLSSEDLIADIPPDIATCNTCKEELSQPGNRRYGYPFINCTNCGPRFTIITQVPYDREYTAMKPFVLCEQCRNEYRNPLNRRFDAQPNACSICGPNIQLRSTKGNWLKQDSITKAVELLKKGYLLALKGIGGYHICCDARNEQAISRLRKKKNRPAKSLAVMFSTLSQIKKYCYVNTNEEKILNSFIAPILILNKKKYPPFLPQSIAPDTNSIGAYLPYTPLHHLLLERISPLIMTSGNTSGHPIVYDEKQLHQIHGPITDYALSHNRKIIRRCDDSICNVIDKNILVLRRSRGYTPDSIELPFQVNESSVLAVGGDLKNTFCMTKNSKAILSQHIGNLHEYDTYCFYQDAIKDFLNLLKINPTIIAYDMHPQYISSKYGKTLSCEQSIPIQHHHAHIAACMAENKLMEPVIGVCLDGTGYGPDSTIWGGEFLIADLKQFKRVGHFKQYPLPGGEKSIKHPLRMALSYCLQEGMLASSNNTFIQSLMKKKLCNDYDVLKTMIEKGINSPLTSSCGRLFDAISALLGFTGNITYEAQAAIQLQTMVKTGIETEYPFEIITEDGKSSPLILSFAPMFKEIIHDLQLGIKRPIIAAMFHNTVSLAITTMCDKISKQTGLSKVALGGGVFQNDLLLKDLISRLYNKNLIVFIPSTVPFNDGGISFGQAAIALAQDNATIKSLKKGTLCV